MTLMITDRHPKRPERKERKGEEEARIVDAAALAAEAEAWLEREAERYSAAREGDPVLNRKAFRQKVADVRQSLASAEVMAETCRRLEARLKAAPADAVQTQRIVSPTSLLDLM